MMIEINRQGIKSSSPAILMVGLLLDIDGQPLASNRSATVPITVFQSKSHSLAVGGPSDGRIVRPARELIMQYQMADQFSVRTPDLDIVMVTPKCRKGRANGRDMSGIR